MRKTARLNGVSVKAYAGTTGVLLAMNVTPKKRAGLLGFALERRQGASPKEWLMGMLNFPGVPHPPGALVPTNVAPVQKFRWSDYRVYADTEYEYTVHPVYGAWDKPVVKNGPAVTVKTSGIRAGEHRVSFNRAAAASQAFSRKFPDLEAQLAAAKKAKQPPPPLPPDALAWLTRDVLGQIVSFIERAVDATWALDIAIYEYELPRIVQAVEAAHGRGAQVRIVYHAKPGDKQTGENEHNLAGLPDAIKRPRVTSKICHHKFIVLSQWAGGARQPQAVLCGSTNFTENGVYRQANVVHVVERADVARPYLDLFEVLFRGDNPAATRKYITANNPFGDPRPLFAGFSPRSGGADLQAFIREIQAARRDVLFCTAFNLHDDLEKALLGKPHDPILRYGLQNQRSAITGYHADRTAEFTAAAMLPEGLEGWLKESTKGQRGNILIHTKLIVVDFTSDAPVVISGSHNLSQSASEGNDENYLILRGDTDVADSYGCELMRLYDHYRFRFRAAKEDKTAKTKPLALTPDDSWTNPYFGGDPLKTSDRLRFAGETS